MECCCFKQSIIIHLCIGPVSNYKKLRNAHKVANVEQVDSLHSKPLKATELRVGFRVENMYKPRIKSTNFL